MNFTNEQHSAIFYRGQKSACVSASAGSGKTAVLVEHIAYLISDEKNKVPADKIAAVTFTEKAAAELKQRLSERVELLLKSDPDNTFLREQLVRLSSARISTISSFCLSLIRDNIRLLPDIDEGFTICDETKADILSQKAEEKVFERVYTDFSEEKQAELFKRLGGKRAVLYSAKKLYGFLSDIPDPVGWKEEQERVFGDPDLYFEKYVKMFSDKLPEKLDELDELCREGIEALPDESKTALNFRNYFEFHINMIKLAKESLHCSDYSGAYYSLSAAFPGTTPAARGKAFEGLGFKERREEIAELYKTCASLSSTAANYVSDAGEILNAFRMLWEIEEMYGEEYRKLKKNEGVLDFSDLEKNALAIVRQGGGKGMYEYIIVDEFQDSNDIQYEIFRGLSDNEKNLYFVGDVKQCIYAYRGANPGIFAGLIRNRDYEGLKLNANFRSGKTVLDAVNALFGDSGASLPESFSEGSPWENMTAGRGVKSGDENISEFITINISKTDKSEGAKNREEKYVAGRISEMVRDGFLVHKGEERERRCGFGDFAVLLRTNGDCVKFRKVFEEYGIPCVSEGEKHFTDLLEIETAIAIISAVLRPNNDAETAKALMSPIYGFTAEDMAILKMACANSANNGQKQDKVSSSLYSNISRLLSFNAAAGFNLKPDSALIKKAKKFDADMKLFRKTASNSVTYDLLQKIYEVTELIQIMRAGYSGKEREENLKLLLHYAKSSPVPADFLGFMKRISRNKLEMNQAVVKEREETSVKLMTIHKSKGLQFPIVFVSGINKSPNVTDTYRDFIFDGDKGLGALVCDYEKGIRANTAAHRVLETDYKDKLLGESMRLFYVALTRAEEKLFVTASNKLKKSDGNKTDEPDEDSDYPENPDNYFAFMINRLPHTGSAVKSVRIPTSCDVTPETNAAASENVFIMPDPEKLKNSLLYKYPYEKATVTPAKFTATALGVAPEKGGTAEEDTATAFYTGTPVFMKEGQPVSGKELGDIYHCVMEHLNFSADSAEKELDRLTKENIITEKEKNAVKAKEIQIFLESGLCKRAVKSGKITREFKLFTTVNAVGAENPENEDLSFIQGIADMFFEEDDGVVLVDYKTNKNTSAEELKREYKGQLMIYRKALEEMLGKKVKECWVYGFELGREVKIDK